MSKSVSIIGAPFALGQPKGGVEDGPKAMRDAGLLHDIKSLGFEVRDLGDIVYRTDKEPTPDVISKNEFQVSTINKILSDAVQTSCENHDVTVVLGGDHSLAIGSMIGHAEANPDTCILWVDAHADLNTPTSSDSKNMHGMPVAFVMDEMQQFMPECPSFDWCKPFLSAKNIAYIGLRDVDAPEKFFIENLGICAFYMQDVDNLGIVEVVRQCLEQINPDGTRKLQVQFDIDGTDPDTVAPATGTPVAGGLSLEEAIYIMEEVALTGTLQVLKMAEVNPNLGDEEGVKKTVLNANKIICAGLKAPEGERQQPINFTVPESRQ